MKNIHIITGATGFLGRHFLNELLEDKHSFVYCLVRSSDQKSAVERIIPLLNKSVSNNLTVIRSDIELDNCDLIESDLLSLKNTIYKKTFWHIAASLAWETGKREKIFKTNLQGTINALNLSKELNCDKFYYVSTAYTSGEKEGYIEEKFHNLNTLTHNEYESSKLSAENKVKEICENSNLNYTILRPAIVIGNSRTFDAVGSTTGLYGFINQLRRFGKRLQDSQEVYRFYIKENAKLSFIPIDYIIKSMSYIKENGCEERVKHLTPVLTESTATVYETVQYILKALNLENRITLQPNPIDNPNSLEKILDRRLDFYKSYLRSSKEFQNTLPENIQNKLTLQDLRKFIDSEINVNGVLND